MSLTINKKKKNPTDSNNQKNVDIFYFLLLDFYSNNFATVIFQHHVYFYSSTPFQLMLVTWLQGRSQIYISTHEDNRPVMQLNTLERQHKTLVSRYYFHISDFYF